MIRLLVDAISLATLYFFIITLSKACPWIAYIVKNANKYPTVEEEAILDRKYNSMIATLRNLFFMIGLMVLITSFIYLIVFSRIIANSI